MDYAVNEDGLTTLKGLRTTAMMHIAMHNALNTIVPVYATYEYQANGTIKADPVAASAQAAFEVAVNQFPGRRSELEEALNTVALGHIRRRIESGGS